MKEMTRRERILAVSRRQTADKLPFFHWWRHSQIGWAEREARNRGMGFMYERPAWTASLKGVDVTEKQLVVNGEKIFRKIYSTPLGEVYQDDKRLPGTFQWHGDRSWDDVTPWQTERLIKGPEDYKVVKYIVEHTEYKPYHFPVEQAKDWLGDEGLVCDFYPHSPMQMLMIDWVGSEGGRFFIHHAKYRDLVEDLYQALSKSREAMYEATAKSPVDVVLAGDNVDGVLVNPRLFEKYFMPEYKKMADIFHAHGKLLAIHMDGRVNVLKDLITRTEIDIIEGLHPPPIGDLKIGDALKLWQNKVVWMGFPGSVYVMGPEATKKAALEILRECAPCERLCIAASTENIVSNENLLMLTSVLEDATLPLNLKKVDEIEKRLSKRK